MNINRLTILCTLAGLALPATGALAQGVSQGGGVSNAPLLQRYLTAGLPSCTAASAGYLAIVVDGSAAAVGTTITGSSNSTIIVACSSAGNWVVN